MRSELNSVNHGKKTRNEDGMKSGLDSVSRDEGARNEVGTKSGLDTVINGEGTPSEDAMKSSLDSVTRGNEDLIKSEVDSVGSKEAVNEDDMKIGQNSVIAGEEAQKYPSLGYFEADEEFSKKTVEPKKLPLEIIEDVGKTCGESARIANQQILECNDGKEISQLGNEETVEPKELPMETIEDVSKTCSERIANENILESNDRKEISQLGNEEMVKANPRNEEVVQSNGGNQNAPMQRNTEGVEAYEENKKGPTLRTKEMIGLTDENKEIPTLIIDEAVQPNGGIIEMPSQSNEQVVEARDGNRKIQMYENDEANNSNRISEQDEEVVEASDSNLEESNQREDVVDGNIKVVILRIEELNEPNDENNEVPIPKIGEVIESSEGNNLKIEEIVKSNDGNKEVPTLLLGEMVEPNDGKARVQTLRVKELIETNDKNKEISNLGIGGIVELNKGNMKELTLGIEEMVEPSCENNKVSTPKIEELVKANKAGKNIPKHEEVVAGMDLNEKILKQESQEAIKTSDKNQEMSKQENEEVVEVNEKIKEIPSQRNERVVNDEENEEVVEAKQISEEVVEENREELKQRNEVVKVNREESMQINEQLVEPNLEESKQRNKEVVEANREESKKRNEEVVEVNRKESKGGNKELVGTSNGNNKKMKQEIEEVVETKSGGSTKMKNQQKVGVEARVKQKMQKQVVKTNDGNQNESNDLVEAIDENQKESKQINEVFVEAIDGNREELNQVSKEEIEERDESKEMPMKQNAEKNETRMLRNKASGGSKEMPRQGSEANNGSNKELERNLEKTGTNSGNKETPVKRNQKMDKLSSENKGMQTRSNKIEIEESDGKKKDSVENVAVIKNDNIERYERILKSLETAPSEVATSKKSKTKNNNSFTPKLTQSKISNYFSTPSKRADSPPSLPATTDEVQSQTKDKKTNPSTHVFTNLQTSDTPESSIDVSVSSSCNKSSESESEDATPRRRGRPKKSEQDQKPLPLPKLGKRKRPSVNYVALNSGSGKRVKTTGTDVRKEEIIHSPFDTSTPKKRGRPRKNAASGSNEALKCLKLLQNNSNNIGSDNQEVDRFLEPHEIKVEEVISDGEDSIQVFEEIYATEEQVKDEPVENIDKILRSGSQKMTLNQTFSENLIEANVTNKRKQTPKKRKKGCSKKIIEENSQDVLDKQTPVCEIEIEKTPKKNCRKRKLEIPAENQANENKNTKNASQDDENPPPENCGKKRKIVADDENPPSENCEKKRKTVADDEKEEGCNGEDTSEKTVPAALKIRTRKQNMRDRSVRVGEEKEDEDIDERQMRFLVTVMYEDLDAAMKEAESKDLEKDKKLPKNHVKCATCREVLKQSEWDSHNSKQHNNLSWIVGGQKVDLKDVPLVVSILAKMYTKKKPIRCFKCDKRIKSVLGFLGHFIRCQHKPEEIEKYKIECPICNIMHWPYSIVDHIKQHKKLDKKCSEQEMAKENLVITHGQKRQAAKKASILIQNVSSEIADEKITKRVYKLKKIKIADSEYEKHINKIQAGFTCTINNCNHESKTLEKAQEHFKTCKWSLENSYDCKFCEGNFKTKKEFYFHFSQSHKDVTADGSEYEGEDSDSESDCVEESQPVQRERKQPVAKTDGWRPYQLNFLNKATYIKGLSLNLNHWCYKSHLEFCENNYNTNITLFTDLEGKWTSLESTAIKNYLPKLKQSMLMNHEVHPHGDYTRKCKSQATKKYKLFESDFLNERSIIFCGGPISSMAWAPTPYTQEDVPQILAVAVFPDPHKTYSVVNTYEDKTIIQFWNYGLLNNKTSILNPAKLEFCLAVDFGPVWTIEWCPSGCHTEDQLGLFALSGSNSMVYGYRIPQIGKLNGVLFKADPVYVLKSTKLIDLNISGVGYYATRISWSKASGHEHICVGYSNGLISVFDLNNTSELLCDKSNGVATFYPYITFHGHNTSVTGVALYHMNGGCKWLASTSLDRTVKFWNLEDMCGPLSIKKKCHVREMVWLNNWICTVDAPDDWTNPCLQITSVTQLRELSIQHVSSLMHAFSTINSIGASDWANIVVQGSLMGEVIGCFMKHTMPFCLEIPVKRYFMSNTRLLTSKGDKVDTKEPGGFYDYKSSINNTKLVFVDYNLKCYKEVMKNSEQHTNTKGSYEQVKMHMYPIQSITNVRTNPNRYSFLYTAVGYQAGFVRIIHSKFLS